MEEIWQVKRLAPLIFWGAVGFWGFLPLLTISFVRRPFVRVFSPLAPITQSLIPGLDGLRGIAAIGIVCFHLYAWLKPFFDPVTDYLPILKHSYKSVPLFVVLSGLLIYRSVKGFKTVDDLRYYAHRRILRIYPLYVISTLFAFAFVDIRPDPPSWPQRLVPELFMMKVFGYHTFISPPAWSLYIEELFYLAVPIWSACTFRRPKLWASLGFIVFSLAGSAVPDECAVFKYFFVGILLCELIESDRFAKVGQAGAGVLFALGLALLYIDSAIGDIIGMGVSGLSRALGSEFVFNTPFNPYNPFQHFYSVTLGVGIGAVILGAVKFRPVVYALQSFPFRFLGAISFSVFIWNGFLMLWGTRRYFHSTVSTISVNYTAFPEYSSGGLLSFGAVYLPAFIAFGSASYLLIERPFLLLRRKRVLPAPQNPLNGRNPSRGAASRRKSSPK